MNCLWLHAIYSQLLTTCFFAFQVPLPYRPALYFSQLCFWAVRLSVFVDAAFPALPNVRIIISQLSAIPSSWSLLGSILLLCVEGHLSPRAGSKGAQPPVFDKSDIVYTSCTAHFVFILLRIFLGSPGPPILPVLSLWDIGEFHAINPMFMTIWGWEESSGTSIVVNYRPQALWLFTSRRYKYTTHIRWTDTLLDWKGLNQFFFFFLWTWTVIIVWGLRFATIQ